MTLSFLSLPYEVQLKITDQITSIVDLENIIDAIPELKHILNNRLYESVLLLNVNTGDNCRIYNLLRRYFARDKHIVRLGSVNSLDPIEGPVKKIILKNEHPQTNCIEFHNSFQKICELNKHHFRHLEELEMKKVSGHPDIWIKNIEIPAELSNLKVLNLENNQLETFPRFKQLRNLQELYLAKNQISSLSSLPPLPSLTKLDLSSNPLFEITDLTNNFINLKHFIARHTQLSNIDGISQLKNLEILDLSYNEIKSLKNFKDLPKLKKLNLHFNCLTSIIFDDQLKHLEELDLSSNEMDSFKNLSKMSRLRSLNLMFCFIFSIDGLNDLKKLETLDLSSNFSIRGDWSLKKLKYLDIDLDDDYYVPGLNFDGYPNLEMLRISGSRIFGDEKLAMLTKLKKLVCSNVSYIDNLPCSLEVLDFTCSDKLSTIEGLSELVNLRELHLQSTNVSKIEDLEEAKNLEVLNLKSCHICKIEGLSKLRSLKVLNLFNSKVKKITGLTRLVNLKELNLGYCQISKIEGLNRLRNLEKLKLCHNSIKKIEGLERLTNITFLDLSRNKITKIEGLENCTKLKSLNLRWNPITSIEGLAHLSNVYFLNLEYQRLRDDEKRKFSRMIGLKEEDFETYGYDHTMKNCVKLHGL